MKWYQLSYCYAEGRVGEKGVKRSEFMKWKEALTHVGCSTIFFYYRNTTITGLLRMPETTKTELIDEKFLKVSYEYESLEDTNRWRITFSRQKRREW